MPCLDAAPSSAPLIREPRETPPCLTILPSGPSLRCPTLTLVNVQDCGPVGTSTYLGLSKPKEGSRAQPLRVNKGTTEKRTTWVEHPTQLGRTRARQKHEKIWHFDTSSEWPTRSCKVYLGSWKNWNSPRSLKGIWVAKGYLVRIPQRIWARRG